MSGNRMKLNLDELERVNGGTSAETGYFIDYCRKKGFTLEEAVTNAQEAFTMKELYDLGISGMFDDIFISSAFGLAFSVSLRGWIVFPTPKPVKI